MGLEDDLKKITDTLRNAQRNPLLTSEIHNKINTGKTLNSTRNALKMLEKIGVSERILHPVKERSAWIHTDFSVRKQTRERLEIELSVRSMHTSDLKAVVKDWLTQIPYPSLKPLCPAGEMPIEHSYTTFHGFITCSDKIPIEDDVLFQDLRRHLPFNGHLFDTWENFKTKYGEFESKKQDLLYAMHKKIERRFKLQVSECWDKNTISQNFLLEMFDACIELAQDRLKDFMIRFNWPTKIEEKSDNTLEFWAGPTGMIKIEKGKENAEDVHRNFVQKWKKVFRSLRGSSYVNIHAKDIVNRKIELETMRNNITTLLEKNLKVPIFPGSCEILQASSI